MMGSCARKALLVFKERLLASKAVVASREKDDAVARKAS